MQPDVRVEDVAGQSLKRGPLIRFLCLLRYVLTGTAALVVLAACTARAGNPTYFPPPQAPGDALGAVRTRPVVQNLEALPFGMQAADQIRTNHAVKDLISPELATTVYKGFFSGSGYDPVVDIYDFAGDLIGELAHFTAPFGLATDKDGRLYVADLYASQIQIIAPPYNGKRTVLNDTIYDPADVAVDGNGNVAVTNYENGQSGGWGNIVFYARGAISPTRSISGDPSNFFYCAFDAYGNLYFDAIDESGGYIGEVVGGINGTRITHLANLGDTFFPGGVQVTKNKLISVFDQAAATIYTFKPPKNGVLGKPVATTVLDGTTNPQTIAFGPLNEHVFVANFSPLDSAQKFAFPAGGAPLQTVGTSTSVYEGVAVTPTEQY